MARDVKIAIVGDASSLKQAVHESTGALGSLGDKIGGVAKVAGLAAGAAAVGGLVALFKTGIDEQKDFLAGQAQLAAGIKSTGGAANVSVDHLEALASSIQNYSGQTDDSIVASEKLLLTFTGIKNQVGKGNDIFDQATKATADMAAKMGGDASASAIQLGKALNDPTQGITALTRVGVSFTDAQKTQIKALQESGNMLGAQKIILKELNTEFGGAAKAAGDSLPGQLARAKRSFEDLAQGVGAALMPAFTGLLNLINKYLLPALNKAVNWVIANWPKFQHVIVSGWNTYIKPVLSAMGQYITQVVIPYWKAVIGFIVKQWPKVQDAIVKAWTNYIKPALLEVVQFMQQKVIPAIKAAISYVVEHWPQIKAAIVDAVKAVVDYVVEHWPQILKAFLWVWDTIKPVLKALGNLLLTLWHSIIEPLIGWVVDHWSQISKALLIAGAIIAVAFKVLAVALTVAINVVAATIRVVVPIIVGIIQTIAEIVKIVADVVMWFYNNVWKPQFDLIVGVVTTAVGWIIDGFNAVVGFFRDLPGRIAGLASNLFDFAKDAATAAMNWIHDRFSDVLDFVTGLPGKIGGAASGMFDGITAAAKWAFNGIAKIWNNTVGRLSFHLPDWIPGGIGGKGFDMPNIPEMAAGGIIKASAGGTLALLGEGGSDEAVVPLNRAKDFGFGGDGGSQQPIIVQLVADGRILSEILLRHKRTNGGMELGIA